MVPISFILSKKLPTWRPRGRLDFQLLYIAAGKAHFHFGSDTEETIVPAGHMVLYRPKEPQKYEYYANDQTEVSGFTLPVTMLLITTFLWINQ